MSTSNSDKDLKFELDSLKLKVKLLEEQIAKEKQINEEKCNDYTKMFELKTVLENKVDKLARELKLKEKENIQNYQIENQKLLKLSTQNEAELKEKDKKIANLEKNIEQLNFQISQKNHEISNQSVESNKEVTRLTIDLEKYKSKHNNLKSKQIIEPDMNIKSLFKNIQANFIEFKDTLDRMDREKESSVFF